MFNRRFNVSSPEVETADGPDSHRRRPFFGEKEAAQRIEKD